MENQNCQQNCNCQKKKEKTLKPHSCDNRQILECHGETDIHLCTGSPVDRPE